MALSPDHIIPLVRAAHAFFDASDRSGLTAEIQLHTALTLGCVEAHVYSPGDSGSAVNDDIANMLGIALETVDAVDPDNMRQRLEPFYGATVAVAHLDEGERADALRELVPDRAALASAITVGGVFHGVLVALDEIGTRVWRDDEREVLTELAAFAGQALRAEEIAADREARDGLTGLLDQQWLRRQLQREMAGTRAVSVVMIDVDHFKRVNDTSGHGAGDAVLRRVAAHLTEQTRAGDVAIRYGGEEFALLLPGAAGPAARAIAERVRVAIDRVGPGKWDKWPGEVTISAGVATHQPDATDATAASLIERADQALYAAKHAGRNRVIVAD
jgi:diguanylate cyclase (GGDEF)-like protein